MIRILIMSSNAKIYGLVLCLVLSVTWRCVASAEGTVDDLPDLTSGVVPVISFKEHDSFTSRQLTSVSLVEYTIRVKNQTGDPVVGDPLVLVIDKIIEISGDDISDRISIEGADGHMKDGRPYFHVPVGDEQDLAPYAESEPILLRLNNPDYLRFFPPTLQVRGTRRVSSESVQGLLETLVNKGVLTSDEAAQALEPPSVPDP